MKSLILQQVPLIPPLLRIALAWLMNVEVIFNRIGFAGIRHRGCPPGRRNMRIASAQFLKSAVFPKDFPPDTLPEIVFVGRSNVGKSSLINAITNQKNLAKTSRTPGKTRLVNFYLINNSFRLVDLPGYGYAQVSGEMRLQWQKIVEDFFQSRNRLIGVALLVDSRRGLAEEEIQMVEFLDQRKTRCQIVLTKSDKLGQSDRAQLENRLRLEFNLERGDYLFTSSKSRKGLDELRTHFDSWLPDAIR